ncbi:MAG: hypothetical protein DRI86_11060 [Bacteroidetes bacterium]|nr:MAG: hypothetical protein DRI86_11060 [Bacteroidota bacterium]
MIDKYLETIDIIEQLKKDVNMINYNSSLSDAQTSLYNYVLEMEKISRDDEKLAFFNKHINIYINVDLNHFYKQKKARNYEIKDILNKLRECYRYID